MLVARLAVVKGPRLAISRAHCVSLFDQASPGPCAHGFNTYSKGTKQALSPVSHPQPASNRSLPGTNGGRAHPLSSAGVNSEVDTDADWEVH